MRKESWNLGQLGLTVLILAAVVIWAPIAVTAGEVSSGVDLRFWGRAVFNMHYDTALQNVDFMSYLVDDQNEALNFNPRDTRLGFSATQKSGDWTYGGVFEIDFYGSNDGNHLLPRLRLGFAEAKRACGLSIRGGQDWVPIAQQNPGTVDFGIQSWSGNLWMRVPQLTVRHRSDQVEFLVGAMKHRNLRPQVPEVKMPWLMGRVGLFDLMGKGSLLALGGAWRSVTISTEDLSPYLAALEFVIPFGDSGIVLNGEAYYGAGFGPEFVHSGLDYNPHHPDGALAIKSLGGFASLKVPVSSRVDLNFGFGMDQPEEDDLALPEPDEGDPPVHTFPYLKNTSFFGNMKYNVTSNFGWGLEAAHFITDKGGATGEMTGQRFTASWWFIF